jgi:Fe2+-dicitrate sensor, membrane component
VNKKDKKTEEFFETGRKLAEKFQEIERIPRHKIDKEFDILMSKYDKITCRKRKINMAIYFSAAASFVLLLTYMFFIKNSNHINSFDSFANEKSVADSSRILITDNNSYFNIDKDAVITYDKTGNVFVKSPGADEEANEIQLKSDTCSIFVPYGQIAKLMLSDNSEVTLNAGSHITFPKVFNSSRREVNLEGEAFFQCVA